MMRVTPSPDAFTGIARAQPLRGDEQVLRQLPPAIFRRFAYLQESYQAPRHAFGFEHDSGSDES